MKKIKIFLTIFLLLFSLIANVVFLMQDAFDGTYYGKRPDGTKFSISFDGPVIVCKSYNDKGEISRQWGGYYEIEKVQGETQIDLICFYGDVGLERIYRNSIFAMPNFDRSSVYVCPMAIAVQVLWVIFDIVLLVFIIKELKKVLKLPKLRIVVEKNG